MCKLWPKYTEMRKIFQRPRGGATRTRDAHWSWRTRREPRNPDRARYFRSTRDLARSTWRVWHACSLILIWSTRSTRRSSTRVSPSWRQSSWWVFGRRGFSGGAAEWIHVSVVVVIDNVNPPRQLLFFVDHPITGGFRFIRIWKSEFLLHCKWNGNHM